MIKRHTSRSTLLLTAALIVVLGVGLPHAYADPGHHTSKEASNMAGNPGDPAKSARTVNVIIKETDDGRMIYEPDSLSVQKDEQIRFIITNKGEIPHEFIIDTKAENMEHAELMKKYPEMEHDSPNMKTLQPGEKTEILWQFSHDGELEFTCLIPGHREAGMLGKISVSGGVEAQTDMHEGNESSQFVADTSDDFINGEITKINESAQKITIKHGPIKKFEMEDGMTMVFKAQNPEMLKTVKPGDKVKFLPERINGQFTITKIKKTQ